MKAGHIASLITLVVISALPLAGCKKQEGASSSSVNADGTSRCEHSLKSEQCPFCTPSLIESDGFCGEHGVAEALCATCRPYLRAAFRAKGDWCDEHNLPESQCVSCNPELADRITGGHGGEHPEDDDPASAGECEHRIAETNCPFCTPSLVESEGFCSGHGVAEALCVKCRPYLKAAFVAAGDWCASHDTPESQCAICNPTE